MNHDPIERARAHLSNAEALASEREQMGAYVAALREVVMALQEVESRLAVQQKLLDDRLLRVENSRLFAFWRRVVNIVAGVLRTGVGRVPELHLSDFGSAADYGVWRAHQQGRFPSPEQARAAAARWAGPKISVVMTPRHAELFEATVRSLQAQIYGDWELCVAVGSELVNVASRLQQYVPVRVCPNSAGEPGMAATLNMAARLATGELLCFPDEGAILSPYALYAFADVQRSGHDLLYCDEDQVNAQGCRTRPLFKPAWSPLLLRACMYIGQLLVVRRQCFWGVDGFLGANEGRAHLHDLALRLVGSGMVGTHVPHVLYHSPTAPAIRTAFTSTRNDASRTTLTAVICSRSPDLLKRSIESLRSTASSVVEQIIVVSHQTAGPDAEMRRVIETAGVRELPYFGVFNFAEMNNRAAGLVNTPGVLFMNDDVTASSRGWADTLSSCLADERTGAVGALLRYPSGDIQHAGIVTGIGDGVGHIGRHMRGSSLWPWLEFPRDVSAVTGACLALRTKVFHSVGGFDPGFPNNYNDVDLCLRLRERGYTIACVPVPGLVHSECQTRRAVVRFEERYRFYRKWSHVLGRPDPFYSTSLAPTEKIALNLEVDEGLRGVLNQGLT